MKSKRQEKILEIIAAESIENQQELTQKLREAGFDAAQATVSRDIRELNLSKISTGGKPKYVAVTRLQEELDKKYIRIFKEGYRSMDAAGNILVIKTASGMAMAVATALDNMNFPELVGSIAGDDTIMCAVRTADETLLLMEKLRRYIK